MNRTGKLFVSFAPAVSDKAAKAMRRRIRRWRLHGRNDLALEDIARWVQPVLVGWVRYYGRFHPWRTMLAGSLPRALGATQIQAAPRAYPSSMGMGAAGQNPATGPVCALGLGAIGWAIGAG